MATKVKLMKFLQELRGFAEIRRPQFASKPAPLFLMQLRSHVTQSNRARRRYVIRIDLKDNPDIPHPVKINYVQPKESDSPTLTATHH